VKRSSYPRPVSRSLKVAAVVSMAMAGLLLAVVQRGRTLRASQTLHELPSTARAVLRIDTRALEDTAAAKTLFDAFVPEEQLSEIEAVCGLDPLAALSEATVWVRGPEDQPFQSIGLMLRGRAVDAATLADCHRLLVETRGGEIVRLDGPAGPFLASRDRRSAIAILDDRTIVTGSVTTVAEAMAVRRRTAPALIERPGFAALWPQLNAGTSIAAVLEPPEHWKSALERVAKLGNEASAIEGLQSIALSVESGAAQTIDVYIGVTDAELAKRDADLIRAWIASPPDSLEPPWTDVLQSARLQVLQRTIVVTLDVSSLSRAR
jgi:hypothetical protein